jgi:hypothetical protein
LLNDKKVIDDYIIPPMSGIPPIPGGIPPPIPGGIPPSPPPGGAAAFDTEITSSIRNIMQAASEAAEIT